MNKFKIDRLPYLSDLAEKLTPDNERQTITITKHCTTGCTVIMIENIYPEFIKSKGQYHA